MMRGISTAGLLALAAQYIGVPVVPLAEQYSLIPEAHGRLVTRMRATSPEMGDREDQRVEEHASPHPGG